MEFPDLGKQCSVEQCNQLDFLPFKCVNCQQIFCKDHHVTSDHDCQCLNEFFKKPEPKQPSEFYRCTMEKCTDRSPIQLLCGHCNQHYCVHHRHHGCTEDVERRKLKVEQWRKPKEQFKAAKEECDKKVEQNLRKAEGTPQQELAQKIRLMKIKGKAMGESKIPTDDRIYFSVHVPIVNGVVRPTPMYTSSKWSVGRSIDLFSKRLKVVNRNNESNESKLRLFKVSNGFLISEATDTLMETLLADCSIRNGDSLILHYVEEEDLKKENVQIGSADLELYRSAALR